jgi:hypothetical protein
LRIGIGSTTVTIASAPRKIYASVSLMSSASQTVRVIGGEKHKGNDNE